MIVRRSSSEFPRVKAREDAPPVRTERAFKAGQPLHTNTLYISIRLSRGSTDKEQRPVPISAPIPSRDFENYFLFLSFF